MRAYDKVYAEGKTKIIAGVLDEEGKVGVISKDDITAGDGAKHDVMTGKAALATRTTSNVFRLLKAAGIPVAFDRQEDAITFIAPLCNMLPFEVVIRREAHGSYLKRAPHLEKGHFFRELVLEFFLKTSGKKWGPHDLVCDDPFMKFDKETEQIYLFDPKVPNLAQAPAAPFLILHMSSLFESRREFDIIARMGDIARQTFLVLEKAWQLERRTLVDFKVEFGLDTNGNLLLADVIDNDSWRVVDNTGGYIDKQVYRDGGKLDDVLEKYRQVAEMTDHFQLPVQQIIIWRGSDKDNVETLTKEFDRLCGIGLGERPLVIPITCSMHKEPVRGVNTLDQLVQKVPDSVVIAFIGRSNGAGPTLSANTTVPVITVPANYREFPDDVWSSLRTPSSVPVATVLEPANAMLAALQILAMRNPRIYAALRLDLEKRLAGI